MSASHDRDSTPTATDMRDGKQQIEIHWANIEPFLENADPRDTRRKKIAVMWKLGAVLVALVLVAVGGAYSGIIPSREVISVSDFTWGMVGMSLVYVLMCWIGCRVMSGRHIFVGENAIVYNWGLGPEKILEIDENDVLCVTGVRKRYWAVSLKSDPSTRLRISASAHPEFVTHLVLAEGRKGESPASSGALDQSSLRDVE